MPNSNVNSLGLNSQGTQVKDLQASLSNLNLPVPDSEAGQGVFGPGTQNSVRLLQTLFKLPSTGVIDDTTHSVLSAASAAIANKHFTVTGRLFMDYGLPAAGVTVRLYSIGFAGADVKLAESTTGKQGQYALSYLPAPAGANVEVRVLDTQGNETTVSRTKFAAQRLEVLNLVAPGRVHPLASEYQRLSADMQRTIGAVEKLGQAQEGAARQDLTFLNQTTGWDARLAALAASAAQLTATTGMGQDALYALFRMGLPTDPQHLALVPPYLVKTALTRASAAGIVGMNADQVAASVRSFQAYGTKARLTLTAPGAVSSFGDLLKGSVTDPAQQTAFADLFFTNPDGGAALWQQAAKLNIPAKTLDGLKLQGKFLYLTSNNAALAQSLQQQVGAIENLPQLADKGFHTGAAWKKTLTSLANGDALDKLIPATYTGQNTGERLEAYAADLARKVRFSFPTQVTARLLDDRVLPMDPAVAPKVSAFLRSATQSGYELGRTPLHAFLASRPPGAPALDDATTHGLKTLHRLHQITPSSESLATAMSIGFTSARDIASQNKDAFLEKYAAQFPSRNEAELVYWKSQQVSSVTFNFFSLAKQLDGAPLVYGLSGSAADVQSAKDSIVQQFPTMASLFGSTDYCECEDCRSVLSPAAYFVDLLEFLRTSAANPAGYTPLDVLVGPDATNNTLRGRRPDLAALPLTCENTNTAMPYIDLVNEILEYFIAHSALDAGAAYDTGDATTDDLTAEPQHVLPAVYTDTLRSAVYPLGLPFDLWVETVRGFLEYFKIPLARVLDALRPTDALELFTDGNSYPYYRAQILAESLGLSPAEYRILTVLDPATHTPSVQKWYQLYGYPDENTALNGQPDPSDASRFIVPPLRSAKNLAQRLGLNYREVTDLVTTGFLNPALYAVLFQFKRFGIGLADAFSYTGQPGTTPLAGQAKTDFEALLDGITQRYKKLNPASTFDARAWLSSVLPANYARGVLVLRDPDSGCDFGSTTLEYADGTAATPLDFLRFNLFVRLWKKLGWSLDETERALQAFLPRNLPAWTDAGFAAAFSSAWKTALVYLAHLNDLATRRQPDDRAALLPLWGNLPTQGTDPLYAQLFLGPSVLGNDPSFDDPAGQFPWTPSDPLSAHQATVQGALGLSSQDLAAILADAGSAVTTVNAVVNGQNVTVPSFSLTNLSIGYRYALLARCLGLPVTDLVASKALSGLNPFQPIGSQPLATLADDVILAQTVEFTNRVDLAQSSGFTVEDLKYLLRHQFDPVGKYQVDPNLLMSLVQSVGSGLRQIQAQTAVPADLGGLSDDLIQQKLSALFPSAILKSLFSVLTDGRAYQASQGGVAPASQIDPAPFAAEPALGFTYDGTTQTQTVTYQGVLLDWKKAALVQINGSPLFSGLLDQIQQQTRASFGGRIEDLQGVWASQVEYEAVRTGVASAIPAAPLTRQDPALALSYDQADQLQWLAHRGVLTDSRKSALTGLNPSPDLAGLLNAVQQQAMPAYRQLVGSLLAMWTSGQTYQSAQTAVAPANRIDPTLFAAWPQAQLSYDATAQVQTLRYQGTLTDAQRGAMAALNPASTVLANLLQDVRNQALQFFQAQAGNTLVVATADLDGFVAPFLAMDAARAQKRVKEELVRAFLPLHARKLSRQLVLQSLAADLGSDPSLTGALLTDAGLLTDPSNPGKSLLASFLAIGRPGVTATYLASADGSGAPLATGTAATVDTADPTNPNAGHPGTGSARFEGVLLVPTDGPYRFFVELGNQNARATLRLTSPDPTALFDDPILQQTAAHDGDEASAFVVLKGGAPYPFTLELQSLGAAGAALLVQGENLPKGPVSQIVLYPQAVVTAFARARTLAAKVLQIAQGFGLDERELSHLTSHAAQFGNLRLGALPTQAADDSPAGAVALFSQFLRLANYADLRKGPAGGTDGLIDVFTAVGPTFTEPLASQSSNDDPATPWRRLASLTRRDPRVIRDVARILGLLQEQTVGPNRQVTAVGDFANDRGLRRIWDALQLLQVVGIPVASLAAATGVVSLSPPLSAPAPDVVAAGMKNAVKAHFTPDAWRPIAQSVFDQLRRKKRDALVAYLVQVLGLENAEQLFEYLLVDPGMEPVVQTSRLRLALSSVQTFIQRCLLNLENGNTAHPERNVAPAAIDAELWAWMKRYRVWEANRKIFLFPENWMEPELRLDKTDLFQALEGALLQGDVTRDLVEDAFLAYLQGLDVRARLDVVSMYLDQDAAHPGFSTLHVLARTYGTPHKYFYRTWANQSWSAWQAVAPDIEGNHVAVMVWRGKVNVFWVTFITKMKLPPSAPSDSDPTAVASLSFGALGQKVYEAAPRPQVQVQLHWSEYFQGKWTDRLSTDPNAYPPIDTFIGFDPDANVFLHVSKELEADGTEGAAKIHLDVNLGGGNGVFAFRVTSKNCEPGFGSAFWEAPAPAVYGYDGIDATVRTGSDVFEATFANVISSDGTESVQPAVILGSANAFAFLECANPVVPPFLQPSEPEYLEAGSLVAPFFFKDRSHAGTRQELTFFVQPSLTEKTIVQWDGWAVGPPVIDPGIVKSIGDIHVVAQVPWVGPIPVDPGDPVYSVYPTQSRIDWATSPTTAVGYQGGWVGQKGGIAVTQIGAGIGLVQATAGTAVNGLAAAVAATAAAAMGGAVGAVVLVGAQGLRAQQVSVLNTAVSALASGTAMPILGRL